MQNFDDEQLTYPRTEKLSDHKYKLQKYLSRTKLSQA